MTWRKLSFEEIFEQLRPFCWQIHTCDMGYRCVLCKAPEKGGDVISEGIGDTLPEAIFTALLCTTFPKVKNAEGRTTKTTQ